MLPTVHISHLSASLTNNLRAKEERARIEVKIDGSGEGTQCVVGFRQIDIERFVFILSMTGLKILSLMTEI
jgi:hypothetical protein